MFHHHCSQGNQLTLTYPWISRKWLLSLPKLETGPLALPLRYGSATWKSQCPYDCESTHCFLQLKKCEAQPMLINATISIRFKVTNYHANFNAGGSKDLPTLCHENLKAFELLQRKQRAAGMTNNWTPEPSCAWMTAEYSRMAPKNAFIYLPYIYWAPTICQVQF